MECSSDQTSSCSKIYLQFLKKSFHLSIFRSVPDGVIYSCSVINVWLWSCSATAVSKGGAYKGRGGRAAAAVIETRQRAHSVGCRLVQVALRRSSCRRREGELQQISAAVNASSCLLRTSALLPTGWGGVQPGQTSCTTTGRQYREPTFAVSLSGNRLKVSRSRKFSSLVFLRLLLQLQGLGQGWCCSSGWIFIPTKRRLFITVEKPTWNRNLKQTWDLSKILHCRNFWVKILHQRTT